MLVRLFRSLFSRDPYSFWRHYSSEYLKRVDELVASRCFDVVHCDILPLAYTIRHRRSVFRSITDHDVSYLKCWRTGRTSRNLPLKAFCCLESLKLRRLESRIFEQVDLGIVVSELDKRRFQRLCPNGRFLVIENGVEASRFEPDGSNVEPNTLLWVGGFNHLPNREGMHYFFEEIYPILKSNLPELRIDLIGAGITRNLKAFASADPSVRLLGFVDDPIPFFQRASVFIVPLLSGGGTRLKLLEAMSMGKAIVTTSMGSEGIPGVDGRHFVLADTPKDFAASIIRILRHPELRIELGRHAREFIEKGYDWEVITRKLNLAYIQLVKKGTLS